MCDRGTASLQDEPAVAEGFLWGSRRDRNLGRRPDTYRRRLRLYYWDLKHHGARFCVDALLGQPGRVTSCFAATHLCTGMYRPWDGYADVWCLRIARHPSRAGPCRVGYITDLGPPLYPLLRDDVDDHTAGRPSIIHGSHARKNRPPEDQPRFATGGVGRVY